MWVDLHNCLIFSFKSCHPLENRRQLPLQAYMMRAFNLEGKTRPTFKPWCLLQVLIIYLRPAWSRLEGWQQNCPRWVWIIYTNSSETCQGRSCFPTAQTEPSDERACSHLPETNATARDKSALRDILKTEILP